MNNVGEIVVVNEDLLVKSKSNTKIAASLSRHDIAPPMNTLVDLIIGIGNIYRS